MDAINDNDDVICTTKPVEAGDANKMASSLKPRKDGVRPAEHELKIMDVEGSVETAPMLTIELEDDEADVEVDTYVSGPPVAELQTALIETAQAETPIKDPLMDEGASTKTEPSSDGEGEADAEDNGSYNGPDPMGLLEQIDTNRGANEDDDGVGSGDDGMSSGLRAGTSSELWLAWMKRCPWLLHEDNDGDYAFCLYCNVVINVNKNLKYIQQHNLSLYHQERENNYMTFKNSKEQQQAALNNREVKHEFGTNSYVAALKRKRANEVETLNNFNWERWLNWHPWLERVQTEGTIGLCKYCNIRMNVEFVYLRKRHEESKGHLEAQKNNAAGSQKRNQSYSNDRSSTEQVQDPKSNSKNLLEEPSNAESNRSDWFQSLPDTHPPQCRCTLCDCRMATTSFMRHLKSRAHCSMLLKHRSNQISAQNRGIWAQYADQHPWLTADPQDPAMGYCHICSRRFMYGHSEIKRKNHENSEKHQAAVAAAEATVTPASEQEEEQSEQEESEAPTENEEQGAESDDDYVEEDDKLSTSAKSSNGVTEPTAKTHSKKSAQPKFSWLGLSNDRKAHICKYCRVRLNNDTSKIRHEHSLGHKKMVRQFKSRQAARVKHARLRRKIVKGQRKNEENENEVNDEEEEEQADDNESEPEKKVQHVNRTTPKPAVKSIPTSMQGKVMVWKDRFPWLSYKRSEQRHNYGWCKLCEVSVFLPSSKFASKHQRSSRHVRLRYDRKRAARQPLLENTPVAPVAAMATGEAKNKAAMAELQAKYDWLEPDVSEENYCRCKICETRLPIKLFFLRQHDGSRKHAEQLARTMNTSEATTVNVAEAERTASVMEVDQESDEALSVKSECTTEEQPPSKRVRRSLEVRRILRVLRDSMGKRQEERSQLDMAKDMICSSFDIVSRLRTLEREDVSRESATPTRLPATPNTSSPQSRDTIDLFFESITQTMKGLSTDLAAEGKAKIMQIVCDLELRAMQRSTPNCSALNCSALNDTVPSSAVQQKETTTTGSTSSERITFEDILEATPGSPQSITSSISIDDLTDEASETVFNKSSNMQIAGNLSEITLMAKSRASVSSTPNSTATAMTSAAAAAASSTASPIMRSKDVPLTIRRILPSTVQITASKPEATDSLRVIPINKLTTASQNTSNVRNSMSIANVPTPMMQRPGQSTSIVNSSSGLHTEMTNGNSNGETVVRKIRVNNGSGTKLITFQKPSQAQHKQQPQHQQQQQHQQQHQHQQQQQQQHLIQQHQKQHQQHINQSQNTIPMRYSSGGNSSSANAHATQAQIIQAQAQLRALNANRGVVRHVPAGRPSQP